MGYTNVALKDKIMAMYPEITQHNISVGLDFSKLCGYFFNIQIQECRQHISNLGIYWMNKKNHY